MNFRTLIAKIVQFLWSEATHIHLDRLLAAAEADYHAAAAAAARAYSQTASHVETVVNREVADAEAGIRLAEQRIQQLKSVKLAGATTAHA